MATGALIFIDHMHTPRPHPLHSGLHVVYYDNNNRTDLFSLLDLYRADVKRSRVTAINGYLHAMKYHRAVCLLDYIFRTVHLKMNNMKINKEREPLAYLETGHRDFCRCCQFVH